MIIDQFNDLFGGIDWADEDRVRQMITVDIPGMVAEGLGVPECAGEFGS